MSGSILIIILSRYTDPENCCLVLWMPGYTRIFRLVACGVFTRPRVQLIMRHVLNDGSLNWFNRMLI